MRSAVEGRQSRPFTNGKHGLVDTRGALDLPLLYSNAAAPMETEGRDLRVLCLPLPDIFDPCFAGLRILVVILYCAWVSQNFEERKQVSNQPTSS